MEYHDIPFQYAVYVGLVSILLCSMLGGMRGVTWTQVAQYIVLIIAYLLPVFWISNKMGAGFFPHFMLADEVARIGELEQQYGFVKNAAADLKSVPIGTDFRSAAAFLTNPYCCSNSPILATSSANIK